MRLASHLVFAAILAAAACTSSGSGTKKDAAVDAPKESGTTDTSSGQDMAQDRTVDQPVDQPVAMDTGGGGETPASCNEVTGSGCTSPMKCALNCATRAIECLMEGPKMHGEACMNSNECGAKMGCVCFSMTDCACLTYCNTNTDCPSGKMCMYTLNCSGDPMGTIRARACSR